MDCTDSISTTTSRDGNSMEVQRQWVCESCISSIPSGQLDLEQFNPVHEDNAKCCGCGNDNNSLSKDERLAILINEVELKGQAKQAEAKRIADATCADDDKMLNGSTCRTLTLKFNLQNKQKDEQQNGDTSVSENVLVSKRGSAKLNDRTTAKDLSSANRGQSKAKTNSTSSTRTCTTGT